MGNLLLLLPSARFLSRLVKFLAGVFLAHLLRRIPPSAYLTLYTRVQVLHSSLHCFVLTINQNFVLLRSYVSASAYNLFPLG
ncbi:hypothetical protein HWC13_gp056 [Nodularia phage vB_NspS-kac68v161]|uniref:Uncharacterized protein n=1 Tax=Nodularia phage vB_NspS-kac68v161 TaxID=2557582 RepID=A0A482MJN5_9CAUD|nr:hypothetical protein HWC13_gp056 [Nodularia phage vB_NspS-kac68v161]QBQ73706.1 hypothetical protein kac68v161_gp056 [Nodularia phage vB_NspS-kac68v161]